MRKVNNSSKVLMIKSTGPQWWLATPRDHVELVRPNPTVLVEIVTRPKHLSKAIKNTMAYTYVIHGAYMTPQAYKNAMHNRG